MKEIKLEKRFPHIKDEDVTSIFQEGYIKGFENGRKGAIPIEWIKNYCKEQRKKGDEYADFIIEELAGYGNNFYYDKRQRVKEMLEDWEKENDL